MTQTQFAQATGISQATQVGYENGAHLPNVHYLNRASALGVDIVFVVLGKRAPQAAVDWVDWDTFIHIVAAIDEWLENNLVTVEREKTLRLAKMLLLQYGPAEEIPQAAIGEHLKLVA